MVLTPEEYVTLLSQVDGREWEGRTSTLANSGLSQSLFSKISIFAEAVEPKYILMFRA